MAGFAYGDISEINVINCCFFQCNCWYSVWRRATELLLIFEKITVFIISRIELDHFVAETRNIFRSNPLQLFQSCFFPYNNLIDGLFNFKSRCYNRKKISAFVSRFNKNNRSKRFLDSPNRRSLSHGDLLRSHRLSRTGVDNPSRLQRNLSRVLVRSIVILEDDNSSCCKETLSVPWISSVHA